MRDRLRGLALSELLVAMAVLLPVAVAAVGILPYTYRIDRGAWALTQAEDVGRSRLERLRSTPWDQLPTSAVFDETREGVSFQAQVTVVPDSARPDLLQRASVTVSWRVGGFQHLTMDTLLARTTRRIGP